MTEPRTGDWMITFTGRKYWPLDPRADEVCIDDIATALAHQGRYNGHGRHFYSVAQHSAELARWFMAKGDHPLARWALLHDAAEAYVGDVIRPLKKFLPGFAEIERLAGASPREIIVLLESVSLGVFIFMEEQAQLDGPIEQSVDAFAEAIKIRLAEQREARRRRAS